MTDKYTPQIPKKELIHGAYYNGDCRNSGIARWNANDQLFYYWREKFGTKFIETICCPEDDAVYDVFVAETLADDVTTIIPFSGE